MGRRPEGTLCWDCRNACGGCSWSREFEPVEGWKAKKTIIKANSKVMGTADSFFVIDCPEFVRDAERSESSRYGGTL